MEYVTLLNFLILASTVLVTLYCNYVTGQSPKYDYYHMVLSIKHASIEQILEAIKINQPKHSYDLRFHRKGLGWQILQNNCPEFLGMKLPLWKWYGFSNEGCSWEETIQESAAEGYKITVFHWSEADRERILYGGVPREVDYKSLPSLSPANLLNAEKC